MTRKLRQCPVCKEWFNTTSDVMLEHYRTKHHQFYVAIRIAAEICNTNSFLYPLRSWMFQPHSEPDTFQWRTCNDTNTK